MSRGGRRSRREFYSIGELCKLLDLKPHVLRYWETQFEALSPSKNRAGNRVYRVEELERVALIRRLLHEEKYTIEGARQRLQEMEEGATARERSREALEDVFLRSMRAELESVLDLLRSPSR